MMKKILILLFVLLAGFVSAQTETEFVEGAAGTTIILGPVTPTDPADEYPSALQQHIQGGSMTVQSQSERDAIPYLRRQVGQTVYVIDDDKTYRLVSGILNTNWTEVTFGGLATFENTTAYPDRLTIVNSAESSLLNVNVAAVTNSGTALATGDQIYDWGVAAFHPLFTPGDLTESVTGLEFSATRQVVGGATALSLSTGYVIPTTTEQTNWGTSYNNMITNLAVTGTTTKTIILTQQDGGSVSGTFAGTATHTGEVTGDVILTVTDDVIDEANLKATNAPTDNYILSYDLATLGFTWVSTGGGVTNILATTPLNTSGGVTPTLTIDNALSDGLTKGAASFTATDFDDAAGNISLDYTNAQKATTSTIGFLTDTDWDTFNDKVTMAYPTAGIALSTGSAWSGSITNNSTNWNTAYSERLRWDGGSTGLVAATGLTSLGGTTIGQNVFTSTNPGIISFGRANADNTFDWLSAANFRTAIGAGTSSTVGTVTSVTAGNGMTQSGTSTINPTLDIVSHVGTAGSIGTINIGADAIGVDLGVTSTTAYRGDYGNTAYSERLRWDGGSTGLTAATGRTSLGGTTIGQAVFTSTNPSAIRFGRANVDNTFDWLSASDFRTAIGAGTTTEAIIIACSDETTTLTAGVSKRTFRMPYAMTLTGVRASVTGAPTGLLTVDINESGTTILSTKLTIDSGEKTSTTAVTPTVVSDSSLADDAEIIIDLDSTTEGAGLKITLIGTI